VTRPKDGGGEQSAVKINLRQLFNCIATVPITTAACERGNFSRMNIICASLRSHVSSENLAALMFTFSAPPLSVVQLESAALCQDLAYDQQKGCNVYCMPVREVTSGTEYNTALTSLWTFM